MTADDANDLLGMWGDEHAQRADVPPGHRLTDAMGVGMAPPVSATLASGSPTDRKSLSRAGAALVRWYRSLRFPVPDGSAEGVAAWEANAATLADTQREATEANWIVSPENKPEGARHTLTWRKIRDDLGDWWVSPSGKILLSAAVYTPPAPEREPPPPAQNVESEWDESMRVYRRDIARG